MFTEKKLVIRYKPSLFNMALLMALPAVLVILLWLYLDRSQWSQIIDNLHAIKENKELLLENQAMQDKIIAMQGDIAMSQRTAKLEKEVVAGMQREVVEHQDSIYRLRNELKFYRGVIDSFGEEEGLTIQGLYITPAVQGQGYYFRLVLSYYPKGDKRLLEGRVSVSIKGMQDGKQRDIGINELATGDELPLRFKFSNFKYISGDILLPDDFVADNVQIQVYSGKKKEKLLMTRIFNWSQVIHR